MSDLVDFLLARIAEDEAQARSATQGTWHPSDQGWEGDDGTRFITAPYHELDISADDQRHITRWQPARVLAECEAKRRLVAFVTTEVAQTVRLVDQDLGRDIDDDERLLELLAQPYAGHADYRQAWAP